jgi:aldehyde:ferredoxin oxidoreductase
VYAFQGRILYVDLTRSRVHIEEFNERFAREYLGATGFNTRLAYDLIPPETDPLGSDNVLIVSAGPFAGTLLPGACRAEVSALSPNGGMFGISNAGVFAPRLKQAGLDSVVVLGRSEKPVYLLLRDGFASIEPADELWGKDVFEATDELWGKHPRSDVLSIGAAGENVVRYACIIGNKVAAFGRLGMGAVLGSKLVKAIVALPGHTVRVADPPRFVGLCRRVFRELDSHPHVMDWRKWGTLVQHVLAPGAERLNEDFDIEMLARQYQEAKTQTVTCAQCPVGCKASAEIKQGRHAGTRLAVSCANSFSLPFGKWIGLRGEDFSESAHLYELANRLGICSSDFSNVAGFVGRLLEAGVITQEALEHRFQMGHPQAVEDLMLDISYRKGIGDVLAEGVGTAADAIGNGAERYAYTMKGEAIPQDPYKFGLQSWPTKPGEDFRWDTTSLGLMVNPSGHNITRYSSITQIPGRSPDALRRFARRCGMTDAEIAASVRDEVDGFDPASFTRLAELYHLIGHSASICNRPYFHRILDIELLRELYLYGAGLDMSTDELLTSAERIITLQRMFNVRNGFTKEHDLYPKGWMESERSEVAAVQQVEAYYAAHGWSMDGVPPKEVLVRLGIEAVP